MSGKEDIMDDDDNMPKSVFSLIFFGFLGCGLALISIYMTLPVGWVGALGLIGWTLTVRWHWAKTAKLTGLEPSVPEQILRFHAVGIALLFGHSLTCYAFPEMDIHFGQGNYLAIDSWTMIAGMLVAKLIICPNRVIHDERDGIITAYGTKFGYLALIIFVVFFSVFLTILPPRYVPSLSYFVLANIQITIILASLLVKYITQLIAYAKDTDIHFTLETDE